MSDVYEVLREKLDQMGKGYPKTETGEEIEILKWFFTPEHAHIFIKMEESFQTPEEFAVRLGEDTNTVQTVMEEMAQKGLLFRTKDEDREWFRPMPMIHGIYEANSDRIDPVFGKQFYDYFGKYLIQTWNSTETPIYRTIPINSDVVAVTTVLPYDNAAGIIRSKEKFAVVSCACRSLMNKLEKRSCDYPIDTCLMFDRSAEYFVDNGKGRYITEEEALGMLERNEKIGLVINVANSQNVEFMCSCCRCCCGVILSLKFFDGPSRNYQSNYTCEYNEETCSKCGKCAKRCAFSAIKMKDGQVQYFTERCYGCGLCISVCPSNSRSLVRKAQDKIYEPPLNLYEAYIGMAKFRRGSS